MAVIVVGVDGSAGSSRALTWAAAMARLQGAEMVAVTGYLPVESELPPGRVAARVAERERQLETWIAPVREQGVAVRGVVEKGDPRPGLLAVAEREDADLIVVGRRGQSGGPGVLRLGSVAEWLAHHVERRLAVIADSTPSIESVLVAVDGSLGSSRAVRWVTQLARAVPLRVVVATVEEAPSTEGASRDLERRRAEVEQRLRDADARDLTAADVAFTPLVLSGADAAVALADAAGHHEVDMIVVGARGLGGFTGLRVGGTALGVLHRADCTVVIVPEP